MTRGLLLTGEVPVAFLRRERLLRHAHFDPTVLRPTIFGGVRHHRMRVVISPGAKRCWVDAALSEHPGGLLATHGRQRLANHYLPCPKRVDRVFYLVTRTSTRRFFARPAAVVFGSTGFVSA
jgi:hypothetical protein